jgi:hypothetical protein
MNGMADSRFVPPPTKVTLLNWTSAFFVITLGTIFPIIV